MNLLPKQRDSQTQKMNLSLLGKDSQGLWESHVYTATHLKWVTKRTYDIAHGTLLNVVCQPGWEGCLRENEYMDVDGECLPQSLEADTTLLISYIPVQNKKKFFGKKKITIKDTVQHG